jgi:serralysin
MSQRFLLMILFVVGGGLVFGHYAFAQDGAFNVYAPITLGVPDAPMQPTPVPIPTTPPQSGFAEAVIVLANEERAAYGCPPLAMEEHLMAAAQGHSVDMATNDFFSHTGSDGSSPWARIRAAGYGDYSYAAENIAAGYNSPSSVMRTWMNSPGHRANILNCNLRDIGVGYVFQEPDTGTVTYRHYWTQVFATPN